MKTEEIVKLMAESAEDAVNFAKAEFNVELDYSIDSISLIDTLLLDCIDILGKQEGQEKRDEYTFAMSNMFGAYMGEIYKKIIGGEWVYDTTDEHAPTVMLKYTDKTFAFSGICYQKLIKDLNVNVKRYFDLAISNNTQ